MTRRDSGTGRPPARTARFRARVVAGHKQHAVEVPFDPAGRWGIAARPLWPGRRGFPVQGSVQGQALDSAIVARSRRYWLLLPDDLRTILGIGEGEVVSVTIAPAGDDVA